MATDPNAAGTTGATQAATPAAETTPLATESTAAPETTPTTAVPTSSAAAVANCQKVGPNGVAGGSNTGSNLPKPDGNNGITGPPGSKGQDFMAVQVPPSQKGTLFTVDTPNVNAGDKLFVHYKENAADMVLKGCRNDESDCENISNPSFTLEDENWKHGSIPLKPDTKKVLLVGDNPGPNQGAIGVASVSVGQTDPCAT